MSFFVILLVCWRSRMPVKAKVWIMYLRGALGCYIFTFGVW